MWTKWEKMISLTWSINKKWEQNSCDMNRSHTDDFCFAQNVRASNKNHIFFRVLYYYYRRTQFLRTMVAIYLKVHHECNNNNNESPRCEEWFDRTKMYNTCQSMNHYYNPINLTNSNKNHIQMMTEYTTATATTTIKTTYY